jgi:hypothetical protein
MARNVESGCQRVEFDHLKRKKEKKKKGKREEETKWQCGDRKDKKGPATKEAQTEDTLLSFDCCFISTYSCKFQHHATTYDLVIQSPIHQQHTALSSEQEWQRVMKADLSHL